MALLDVRGLTVEREGLPIVRNIELGVEAGAITVLLGVNGAGKTTLLEGISGAIAIAAGQVLLGGVRLDRRAPFVRARAGLAHVEQGRTVLAELSTRENLLVAAGGRPVDEAYELFPELHRRASVAAGLLSGGEQQMLVLARAMLRHPKVLMVDELSLGLAPRVLHRLMAAVANLGRSGMAILLVEQFAQLALAIGSNAYVLRGGEIVYSGGCAELRDNPDLLQNLYLGDLAGARR
ncbi:MAG: ABC transporter ATP-binding protein [Jatrophihabitantaceae bacterium]